MNKKFANLICGLEDTDGSTNGTNPLGNRTFDDVADEEVIILNDDDDLNNARFSRAVAERLENIAEQDRESWAMESAQLDEEIKRDIQRVFSASKGYHKFTVKGSKEEESEEKKLMGQEDEDEFDDYSIIVDREVEEATIKNYAENENDEKVNTLEKANSINNDIKTESSLAVTGDTEDLESDVKVELYLDHDGEIYLLSDSGELDWNTSIVKDEADVADVDGNAIKMETEDSLPVDHVKDEKTDISTEGYEDLLRMIANTKEEVESDTEVADAIESMKEAHKESARKVYKCKKCKYEGTWNQYIVHAITRCTGTIFNCTVCEREFFDLRFYLNHLVKHGYAHLTCPECQEPQKYPSELYSHVTTHIRSLFLRGQRISEESENQEGYYVFNCKACTKRVDPEQFFEHWQMNLNVGCLVVNGQAENSEDEDDRSLEKLSDSDNEKYSRLQPHVIKEVLDILQRTITDKKKVITRCHVCSKHFSRKNDCKRHLIMHLLVESMMDRPTTNNRLRCCFCPKDFSLTADWKQHMREHSFLPAFKCELCSKFFSDCSNFSKHKKLHNLFSFICDLCGEKFNIKRNLKQHLKMHKKRSLECKYCQLPFISKFKLRKHEMIKHYTIPNSYLCIICKKRFFSMNEKLDHQWVKHKLRNVCADCPLCKKPFRRHKDVATHMKDAH